jgi:hypothetical protein
MNERPTFVIALAGGCLAAIILVGWLVLHDTPPRPEGPAPSETAATPAAGAATTTEARAPIAGPVLRYLQRLAGAAGARPREAILRFANAEAYRRFLARARRLGLPVIAQMDGLFAVRVRFDSLAGLQDDLAANAADYADVDANFLVNFPQTPTKEERAATPLVALGNRLRSFLGVTGDPGSWGRGITIAVLDSGVAADATFGQGRLRSLDIGLGTAPGTGTEDGHGTAVAALAAGMAPDAAGVAPAASILSIRVTDASSTSDIFTLAQAILAAVDAGAEIINISLGSYATSSLLTAAVEYAGQHGVVIVASAGNDQAAQLTWPAAYAGVVSVGAVDALEQQVTFSNSGEQLDLTAPGYGVQTAWLDGQRVSFDGTSASAPIVAGAIAALMSANPGLTAAQAVLVLEQYASDGGAPGRDPDYGSGVINLGWAMDRNNALRTDTAISSNYYDAATGEMEFVVQNRSGIAIGGMVLSVDADGTTTTYSVPLLSPGATYVVKQAVDQARLTTTGGIVFRSRLDNPGGVVDQVPANNYRTSALSPPPK